MHRVGALRTVLDQHAVAAAVESPAVIRADVELAVAGLALAHRRALVWAHVQEGADRALVVAVQQHRLAADPGGQVIERSGQLRFVRQEHPVALEHVAHFQLEQRRVAVHVAVDIEHAGRRVVAQVAFRPR